jgi:molybdate transport system substrate-binding protein
VTRVFATLASTLTVFAAASLTDVMPRIDSRPHYSFAGSDTLALQIRQGAPADVFLAASATQPSDLFRAGLVYKPVVFATNELVLVVPRSNPAHIKSVLDIGRSGIKLVVAAPTVPAGAYTRTVLSNLGMTSALANVVSEEPDVRSVLAKVALGEADAGFVYVTDARSAGAQVTQVKIPAWAEPRVRYELAIVKATRRLADARAFVRRVLSKAGRARLKAAGFGLP